VACVPYIALTRIAEPWSMWNLVGLALVVFVAFGVIYVLVSK
jgi:hypothetical protein